MGGLSSAPPGDSTAVLPKFRVPVRRTSIVSRSEVIERITGSDRPLAVVTAPAGYGKTTLLVELAALETRKVVWVSLDPSAADPVALARDVAAGMSTNGLADESLTAELGGAVADAEDSALGRLGSAMLAVREPFVLVIDDAHLIDVSDGCAVIDGLVDHLPPGCQMVVAGRTELPFVARRRVSAEVVEIGANDLAFRPDAVLQVYGSEGMAISPEQAGQVVERTEGWAAGVYLSALVSRARAVDGVGVAVGIDGSTRHVADYLLHHVFDDTDVELQEFLLDAALLDELNAQLCDDALGLDTSAEALRRLEQSNLFAVAIGDDRAWFRLHSLFREFLLDERSRRRPPGHGAEVLQRAATWCEANGQTDQAIEYLLRAGDVDRLGPALTAVLQPTYDEGRSTTVDRWLREAGDVVVDHHPPLAVLAGWMAAVSARPAHAEQLAARLERLHFDGATEDGWLSFDASRAAFRALLCANGVAAMNRDAEQAVEGAPAWSPWRSTALWLLGQARELAGRRDEAAQLYDDAVRADLDLELPPLLVPIVCRALLAIGRSDWELAADRIELALQRAEVITPSSYLEGAMAHAAAARLSLHRRDPSAAERHLEVAMASRGLGTYALPHSSIRLRTTMAMGFAALGAPSVATSLLGEIDLIVARRPEMGSLLEEIDRVREALVPDRSGVIPLTAAEHRVLVHLSSHLTFAEIGRELFISRNTVHTHTGSIYRKFGVTSRGEAVERARHLGLI